jgi:hypothetical protein
VENTDPSKKEEVSKAHAFDTSSFNWHYHLVISTRTKLTICPLSVPDTIAKSNYLLICIRGCGFKVIHKHTDNINYARHCHYKRKKPNIEKDFTNF